MFRVYETRANMPQEFFLSKNKSTTKKLQNNDNIYLYFYTI